MDRIERLKAFLAESPDDSFVQHALALEYIKTGDDATARQYFEQVLRKNEDYIGSYYHLAKLLERGGQKEEAVALYEKGMQKARSLGDQHAYNELKMAHEELTDD